MVRALDDLPIALPLGKREGAVRAHVPQRKGFSGGVPPEHQPDFEAQRFREAAPADFVAAQRRVPESPQQFAVVVRTADSRVGRELGINFR